MAVKLAAQFYTLRQETTTAEGFRSALKRCADMGYEGVQLSAVGCMNGDSPEVTAEQARAWLDEFGLVCCATHRPWNRLRDNTAEEIQFHRTLGCAFTAIGGLFGEDAKTVGHYRAWLESARPAIGQLKSAGIQFGYHNHDHEFIRDRELDLSGYEVLLREGGEDLMLEIDTYWIQHAGACPAAWLRLAEGRIPQIHMKDKEVVLGIGPVMCPVGEGNMDWAAIISASRDGGTEWLIVEQDDCRRDPFDCLRSSYEFLRTRIK